MKGLPYFCRTLKRRMKFLLTIAILVLSSFGTFTSAQTQTPAPEKRTTPLVLLDNNQEEKKSFVQQYVIDVPKKSTAAESTKQNTDPCANEVQVVGVKKVEKTENGFASDVVGWLKDKYSMMMEVMPNQISNVMIYRFIDDWYGVRYRMGGTTKQGVDCSSFVQQLYKYAFSKELMRTASMQFESTEFIRNKEDLKEGDLVFFKIGTSRISHVGVYLNNNYFVHSATSKGVSIANLNGEYWSRYFVGGGRVKKEE